MDFYSMPRRQLQALCKQNRIPANITNVAMADALQALHADGSLENAQEVLQDLTPFVPSSRKASLLRQAPASAVIFESSIEPRKQPASPLPRARRVTVNASEIRRLAVGEENEKEEVEKEAVGEATPTTVTKCSSMKPPPRSTRRASKKNDVEVKEEELIDAMKTPAPLTGRRPAAGKLAKTSVAVEQEAADTVVSARVTTRRNTRQSTRATIQDSAATSTVRRSSRIRAKTEESALKMGSSFQEVDPEQDIEKSNALVEEDDNGDKDCDLAVVDSDVPQNSLEEAVIAPEVKEFATMAVVSEEEQLDKGEDKVEVDNHCEKGCTLVVVGDNIQMHDLEEDRIIPNAEELGVAKDELIDMPTEDAPEADVKELGTVAQQHLVSLHQDEEKPMDNEVDEIAPETDVKELESGDTKDDSDINEDGGIHGDQHQVVESGENDDNEDELIQESEVSIGEALPETECDFEGSPVQGLITSLENLEITKDLHLEDHAPEDDETERAADEYTKEIAEDFHLEDLVPEDDETKQEIPGATVDSFIRDQASDLEAKTTGEVIVVTKCQLSGADRENYKQNEDLEDLASEDDETKHEIPGATVDSFIQNQASDIPEKVKTAGEVIGEVIAVTKCQLSGADRENYKQNEDFHLEDLASEDDETKHEIPGATVDSFIQNQASDIPEKVKTAGEVIAVTKCQLSGADKENDQYSAELSTDVVVNEDEKKQNVQGNLELMSLRMLKKLYKEKIISNVDKVETKRQALNDVNQNIVS